MRRQEKEGKEEGRNREGNAEKNKGREEGKGARTEEIKVKA